MPESRRRALNLKLPPLTRTRLTVTLLDSFVMAGWRPSSYLHGAASSAQRRLHIWGNQAEQAHCANRCLEAYPCPSTPASVLLAHQPTVSAHAATAGCRSQTGQARILCYWRSPAHDHSSKSAYFLFLRHLFCFPPVSRLLCRESREIPAEQLLGLQAKKTSLAAVRMAASMPEGMTRDNRIMQGLTHAAPSAARSAALILV